MPLLVVLLPFGPKITELTPLLVVLLPGVSGARDEEGGAAPDGAAPGERPTLVITECNTCRHISPPSSAAFYRRRAVRSDQMRKFNINSVFELPKLMMEIRADDA